MNEILMFTKHENTVAIY